MRATMRSRGVAVGDGWRSSYRAIQRRAMSEKSVQIRVVQRPIRKAVFEFKKGASVSKKRLTIGEKGLSLPVRALCRARILESRVG